MLRRLFRDKLITCLLLLSVMLALYALFMTIVLGEKLYEATLLEYQKQGFLYQREFLLKANDELLQKSIFVEADAGKEWQKKEITRISETLFEEIKKSCDEAEVIWYSSLEANIGNAVSHAPGVSIMASSMDWYMPLREGVYPTQRELLEGQRIAYVSEGYLEWIEEKDDKRMIAVEGHLFEVKGVLENRSNAFDDDMVVCFHEFSDAQWVDFLISQASPFFQQEYAGYLYLSFGCQEEDDFEAVWSRMEHFALNNQLDIQVVEDTESLYRMERVKSAMEIQAVVMGIVVIFHVLTVVFVALLWSLRKKREFAIAKAFGMDIWQLLVRLAREVGLLCICAFICAGVVMGVYSLITQERLAGHVGFLLTGALLAFLLIYGIIIIVNIRFLYRIQPAEAVREGDKML